MVVFQPRVTMVKNSVQMVTVDSNLSPRWPELPRKHNPLFLFACSFLFKHDPKKIRETKNKHILTLFGFVSWSCTMMVQSPKKNHQKKTETTNLSPFPIFVNRASKDRRHLLPVERGVSLRLVLEGLVG